MIDDRTVALSRPCMFARTPRLTEKCGRSTRGGRPSLVGRTGPCRPWLAPWMSLVRPPSCAERSRRPRAQHPRACGALKRPPLAAPSTWPAPDPFAVERYPRSMFLSMTRLIRHPDPWLFSSEPVVQTTRTSQDRCRSAGGQPRPLPSSREGRFAASNDAGWPRAITPSAIWAKNLARQHTAALLQFVRSIDFSVQFAVGRRWRLDGLARCRMASPV